MFISDFMTKDVVTIGVESDISKAKELMNRFRIRHLPVTRADNKLIGIVSDRDIRSALPSEHIHDPKLKKMETENVNGLKVREFMTKNPVFISQTSTLQDALVLIEKCRVGAFPVVNEHLEVVGIISDRDLLNAFISVLGIKEPGALLGIVVDEDVKEMDRFVQVLIGENINFGSILVCRNWRPGKRAVFPYLLTKNTATIKTKFIDLGYVLIDPIDWHINNSYG